VEAGPCGTVLPKKTFCGGWSRGGRGIVERGSVNATHHAGPLAYRWCGCLGLSLKEDVRVSPGKGSQTMGESGGKIDRKKQVA